MYANIRVLLPWIVLMASAASQAQDSTATEQTTLDPILITAQRAARLSSGAIGLNLDVFDTPQSIGTVTAEQMRDFGANDINSALRLATGLNVEEWETNRTNYMARGFDIKNTQVDGVGLPNDWGIVTGAMDSAGYEKIEVIRGANGLLTGVGSSAGTINYVRKRPTNEPRASFELSGGSWNFKRLGADYSTPLTGSGSWAARLVVAGEDKDSYLRGLSNKRTFAYGVIDGQLGEHSTLTLGYSYQKALTRGNMWGALVLAETNGTQASFDPSVSTTQDWTRWDTRNQTAFAEFTHSLTPNWTAKLSYNYRSFHDDSKLFFVYSFTGLDASGLGLFGWPGSWPTWDDAHMLDANLNGKFTLLGREQQLLLGVAYSRGKRTQHWRPVDSSDPAFGAMPSFPYAGNVIPEPTWGPETFYGVTHQRLQRGYGATRISLTEKLSAIGGFNWARYHRDGEETGTPFTQTESKFSPYAGLTYALLPSLTAYASYSDIYQPQDYQDLSGRYLDPTKGVNYEAGLKAEWLDKRLLATVAWFSAEQKGLGTFAGMNADGNYYYTGVDVRSRGVEAELNGRLSQRVELLLGFTSLSLRGVEGSGIYPWVPRRTANLALTGKLPGPLAIRLGAGGRWQSGIDTTDGYTPVVIRQGSYATLNAFAHWDITPKANVQLNVNNLTDRQYISSLYQVGFYGAPRNVEVTLGYQF